MSNPLVTEGSEAKQRVRVVLHRCEGYFGCGDARFWFFSPEFLREPPERGWVDTLPLRSGKNSSFEIEARQHAEGLQV